MAKMQNKYLSVIAYANGFTLWHYRDIHISYEDLDLTNFFDPIYTLCQVGDKIMISTVDAYIEAIVVKLHSGSVVCREIFHVNYETDEFTAEEDK